MRNLKNLKIIFVSIILNLTNISLLLLVMYLYNLIYYYSQKNQALSSLTKIAGVEKSELKVARRTKGKLIEVRLQLIGETRNKAVEFEFF